MAAVQEAVRRLSIQATTSGVDQAAAKLDNLAAAQDGVAVASSRTEKATLSLDSKFASIERRYVSQVRAQQDYEKTQRQVNAAVAQNPALQDRANVVLAAAAERYSRLTSAANDNSEAHAGLSTQAMAAQHSIRSVVEQMLLGISPSQALLGQINHLSYAATGPGGLSGAFKEVGSILGGLLTPMRLIGVGAAAAGVAAYASFSSWKTYALAIDDVRRVAGTTSQALSGLTSAAGFKGIGSDDFLAAFRQFNSTVAQAKIGVGDLATLFRATGQSIGTTQQTFEKLADDVKNAGDDWRRIEILQQAGLPTTRAWVDFMSQGAAGIREAVQQATAFGGAANDNMVRRAKDFEDSWHRGITNLKTDWNNLFLSIFGWFDDLSSKGTAALIKITSYLPKAIRPDVVGNLYRTALQDNVGSRLTQSKADEFYGSVSNQFKPDAASGGGRTTPNPNAIIAANSRYIQSIGVLGDYATTEQKVAAASKQMDNQFLQTGVSAGKLRDAVLLGIRAQDEMNRVQQQAQIGVFNLDAANKAAADTLQTWIDKKLLDPTNSQQMAAAQTYLAKTIRDTADASKVAGSNLPQLQQALNDASSVNKQIDQFATSSFSNITTGLADIFDGTKTAGQGFADLGKTVIRALEEMLIKMYIVVPIFNALKGALGGIGGIFGFSGGGLVDAGSSANPLPGLDASDYGAGYASGGYTGAGGKYQPAGIVHAGEYVFNQTATANLGVGFLESLHRSAMRGYDVGGLVTPSAPNVTPFYRAANENTGDLSVVVNNNGAPVKVKDVQQVADGRGGRRVELTLDDAVATAIQKPGSATQGAMRNTYQARKSAVKR